MMPPGTMPMPVPCCRKSGLNGLELFRPYREPPGCVAEYRLAVDSARPSLLKSLAVLAFAIAMARLPGQASPTTITEQSRPCRSTTADHIRLGRKMPPLSNGTTAASWLWTPLTTVDERLHPGFGSPSPANTKSEEAKTAPSATTSRIFGICCLLPLRDTSRLRRGSWADTFWLSRPALHHPDVPRSRTRPRRVKNHVMLVRGERGSNEEPWIPSEPGRLAPNEDRATDPEACAPAAPAATPQTIAPPAPMTIRLGLGMASRSQWSRLKPKAPPRRSI